MSTDWPEGGPALARISRLGGRAGMIRGLAVVGLLHLIPVTLFYTGTRPADWIAFGLLYLVMIFGVGGGLHRYFAHRAFRTTRAFQFVLGLLAGTVFGDPIGFSARHRIHHRYSDTSDDPHSPQQGVWRCWLGSLFEELPEDRTLHVARDLTIYPELVWLHHYYYLPAMATAVATYVVGGYTMFATGFCLSFVAVLHATSAVNYWCHKGSRRPYPTSDRSVNRPVLAFFILGEGWHNNHHFYPSSARAGFSWRQPDAIFCVFRVLAWFGLIWDLIEPPGSVVAGGRSWVGGVSRRFGRAR